ncbi:hypothetical protein BpHYR1_031170 [Brachionus plicatilis]|uniref:Uncharacterized protein n=1 Tax=Brachionus plicatilis TaxID=10195 RepID=A0A3M7RT76_BRAPC|nr:hypothetical protein BpHYR1_031170 [Brachionus plicatilis]
MLRSFTHFRCRLRNLSPFLPSSPIIATVYISDPPELTVNISVIFEVTVYFSFSVSAPVPFLRIWDFFFKIFGPDFRLRESSNFCEILGSSIHSLRFLLYFRQNLLSFRFCRLRESTLLLLQNDTGVLQNTKFKIPIY